MQVVSTSNGSVIDAHLGAIQGPIDIHPSNHLTVIGVTGTNGKTTVCHLIGETLKFAGHNPFVLGTLNSGDKDLSTPNAVDIHRFMTRHLNNGGTHFVMEVTSEGIDQQRIESIDFDVKLLTNITQDHLDYHKTFKRYRDTKLAYMREGNAHKIYPRHFAKQHVNFETQLVGNFNLLNVKAAVCALKHLGISDTDIQRSLSSCSAPTGRMERIELGQPYMVLVDYAHTPDGLRNVLSTAKSIAQGRRGRLLVLFGCGGNRDPSKRPKMGKIACRLADLIVITDDNPRQEESQEIRNAILSGFDPDFKSFYSIQNRRSAIDFIVDEADDEDVIVLAGKGHENYQTLRTETIRFEDREEAIRSMHAKKPTGSEFWSLKQSQRGLSVSASTKAERT